MLAPVVQCTVIHCMAQVVFLIRIRWIVILLVDRGVQFLSELDHSLRSMAVLFGRANKLSDCRASAEEP